MTIAIDIRPLQNLHRYRGIGHYLRPLVSELVDKHSTFEFVFIYDQSLVRPSSLAKYDNSTKIVWLSDKDVKKRSNVDILLKTDIFTNLKNIGHKNIAIFYDAIPYRYRRQYFGSMMIRPDRLFRYMKYLISLQKLVFADKIVTISESSKNDLCSILPFLNRDKVTVIYPGAGTFKYTSNNIKPSTHNKYLLYVGSCDFRKNVVDIIRAHSVYCREYTPIELRLIGRDMVENCPVDLEQAIASSPYTHNIKRLGYVSDRNINHHYANAQAFIFASQYEGFGLPILEAMLHGCPVITYRNSSLVEVGGDSVLYAKDPQEIAEKANELNTNVRLRKKLVNAGMKRTSKFNWQDSVKQFEKLFKECLS